MMFMQSGHDFLTSLSALVLLRIGVTFRSIRPKQHGGGSATTFWPTWRSFIEAITRQSGRFGPSVSLGRLARSSVG
ncbi:hypothetical protein EB233_21895 [Mesorhizobium erdmanii]|uniref:Uncharacterized protein n=1 Tax=Mesorhizobium erdmanii TaxID=1777866 RepID=A0A6M7UL10_9HYPH|nr:hypothetical protein A8146_18190 [Mesorhizobium loti]QKC77814.1 hypothetical protein EB233_21895 [Mesorhizobium erdmanii]